MNLVKHLPSILQRSTTTPSQTRTLFGMLNSIFNKPDEDRIKEVGPDRACAEWLLRCGAHFRWKDFDNFHTDYNTLPPGGGLKYKIEEIDAKGAAVMDIGFRHFAGCKHIRKIRFYQCGYLNNDAIVQLPLLKDSLEILEISGCGDVSERGLLSLAELTHLRQLMLRDLPEVRNKEKVYKTLTDALPDCDITYIDFSQGKKAGR